MNIAAISGSLKSASTNINILKAIAALAPEHVHIAMVAGLEKLPHFSPDIETGDELVNDFRKRIGKADGVIFSTPEYAFGIPGSLKNALDWLVSSGELNEKPIAAISASPLYSGGDKALASLLLTLTALGTRFDAQSSISIGNIKNKMSPDGTITDVATIQALQSLLTNLMERISKP
ncbi:NADPH-dependent FMN reductase [Ferruginibacter paludis]|uniref:NADPH-dependent FMN reductase n=1 Tax=Ferruginibacter paludis TaxID=1310417 RepID=UPI0025B3EC89|nr:NADPH-dependent FMN reductase [Ferruginibacter paludis]MDN3659075.1 NADPH-dependent FMN reductase [Ferruginibacter paludis]